VGSAISARDCLLALGPSSLLAKRPGNPDGWLDQLFVASHRFTRWKNLRPNNIDLEILKHLMLARRAAVVARSAALRASARLAVTQRRSFAGGFDRHARAAEAFARCWLA
jgi:hypothetical protein